MSLPAVSVIMAAYKGRALIGETIATVQAQTLADWELIVVDDCCPEDTGAVVEAIGDPRIRLIRAPENGGPVLARNRAFAEARGRYVAALDQDDLCLPTRFARQVAYLEANPDTVLVSSAARVLCDGKLSDGNWPRPLTPGLIDWLMLVRNPLVWSSVMFRAGAARRLDPFERPAMRYVEDFDLYHRLRPFGRIAQIDEVLLHYRSHAGGASQQFNATMTAHAQALLADRHAELLGAGDPQIAPLVVRHAMSGEPVPDAATLNRLFAGIEKLRNAFAARDPGAETLALADREISRLWWALCRAGIRSGRLALPQVLVHRPAAVALGEGRLADLAVSQMIGGVRAVRRSIAARG